MSTTTDAKLSEELEGIILDELGRRFPAMKELWAVCPVCNADETMFSLYLDATIIHMNDGHGWTREQIADWIEQEFGDIMEVGSD